VRVVSITARRLVVFASITVVLLVAPGHRLAFAHDDDRLDTTPASGETVQSAAAIVVDFTGPVDGERFEVIDPSGERVEGTASVTDDGVATFEAAAAVTDEGEYTVRYVAQSADGHLVSGEFAFTIGDPAQNGGGPLRWIAGASAVFATLSIAAAATILRRRRTRARHCVTELSHGAGPNVTV
jgi:methionine-rich copper-binding protein CopC